MNKILVIDDEKMIVDMLAFRLSHSGYEVVAAHDGEEGLAAALRSSPDLVLVDIMMPKMDGNEFIKKFREEPKTKKVPVIILTASVSPEMIERARKAGADDYLLKPFDSAILLEKIKKVLERGRA